MLRNDRSFLGAEVQMPGKEQAFLVFFYIVKLGKMELAGKKLKEMQ